MGAQLDRMMEAAESAGRGSDAKGHQRALLTEELAGQALLVEAVIRRVLLRYQEHLRTDDAHRRSLQVVIDDLPSLVIGAVQEVTETYDKVSPRTR